MMDSTVTQVTAATYVIPTDAPEADGTLRLSSGRADRFAGQTWLHRAGQEKPLAWPAPAP